MHLIGLCHYAHGELDRSEEAWNRELTPAEEVALPIPLCVALDDLGNLAARRGDYERAIAYHSREHEISLRSSDKYSEFYAVPCLCRLNCSLETVRMLWNHGSMFGWPPQLLLSAGDMSPQLSQ